MASLSRLTNAVANGDTKLVTQLLQQRCDVNNQGSDGMTALAIASFWGYTDIVNILLKNGADVNAVNKGTNWTALHCAAFQGHGPVVLSLLRAGSSTDVLDSQSRSPADFASAVDAIWPLFAAVGCQRTTKSKLLSKRIIVKEPQGRMTGPTASRQSSNSYLTRPGSSYVLDTSNLRNFNTSSQHSYEAAVNGDVLANEMQANSTSRTPTGPWKFL